MGYTVEGQISRKEKFGGIQITVFDPKPGRFRARASQRVLASILGVAMAEPSRGVDEMGLGAGGKMQQKIYPDAYGVETWNQNNYGTVDVHIVNSMMYRDVTGFEPPHTPVSAKLYSEFGLPWFDLYDEHKGDVGPSKQLARVKTIKEKDKEHGLTAQQDASPVSVSHVKKLKPKQT